MHPYGPPFDQGSIRAFRQKLFSIKFGATIQKVQQFWQEIQFLKVASSQRRQGGVFLKYPSSVRATASVHSAGKWSNLTLKWAHLPMTAKTDLRACRLRLVPGKYSQTFRLATCTDYQAFYLQTPNLWLHNPIKCSIATLSLTSTHLYGITKFGLYHLGNYKHYTSNW